MMFMPSNEGVLMCSCEIVVLDNFDKLDLQ